MHELNAKLGLAELSQIKKTKQNRGAMLFWFRLIISNEQVNTDASKSFQMDVFGSNSFSLYRSEK